MSARRSGCRSVAARPCFSHGFNTFFGAQQGRSFDVLQSASCRERNRNSCGIHVVRHLKNAHNVMLAECQPAVFDFSVELFNSWAYRFEAALRVRYSGDSTYGAEKSLAVPRDSEYATSSARPKSAQMAGRSHSLVDVERHPTSGLSQPLQRSLPKFHQGR